MRSQKLATGISIALALIIVGTVFSFGRGGTADARALDGFAQCLTDKGFTMYGAYWCPHCQNEKRAFGDSFRYVRYVECTEDPNICARAGIKGFPTWITDDGRKFEGEQGVERLSELSSCSTVDSGWQK